MCETDRVTTVGQEPTVVYTDGACRGNPGPGGWGWVVPEGPWANGADPDTTNQRMELQAALDALRTIEGPVELVSDSTYVVNCFRDGWWKGWLKRGWKNSKKEPVANRDIWEPLIELYQGRADEITFRWVKGHAGDEWNDIADRLAVEASHTQKGRMGVGLPPDLGEADDYRNGGAQASVTAAPKPGPDGVFSSTWRPHGRAVMVLGMQPPGLGGYDDNPIRREARRRLGEVLAAKHQLDHDLVVLTGLRLGAETLAAEVAAEAGMPYVAVLPYPDPDVKWPGTARQTFASLVEGAHAVVRLERKSPESAKAAGQALDRRNGWLRKVSDEAVVVWDGADARIGRLIRDLERDLPDDVWIVEV